MKERPIAFYAEIARELGSISSAIFYQQIRYWSDKGNREDGWIYKTAGDIERETTLTEKQQRLCKEKLIEKGWIETQKIMFRGSMVWHYRLLVDFTFSMVPTGQKPVADVQKASSTSVQKASSSIHRIHTENTTGSSFKKTPRNFLNQRRIEAGKEPMAPKALSEKQLLVIKHDAVIRYFHRQGVEMGYEYLSEEDEAANKKFLPLARALMVRYPEKWKELVDWWFLGKNEWCDFHPSGFFSINTWLKFENRNNKKIDGKELSVYPMDIEGFVVHDDSELAQAEADGLIYYRRNETWGLTAKGKGG
jgi:hypothetical protein